MLIKPWTSLVTRAICQSRRYANPSVATIAITMSLLILLSPEGLKAQIDEECDRYARETTEWEEGGVIRNCIANTQANLIATFNKFY